MNINVYFEDALGNSLKQYAKKTGKTRNTIVREAVREWLEHHKISTWPNSIKNFTGITDFPAFELHRNELILPDEDPLA